MQLRAQRIERIAGLVVPVFVVCSVLWKGGKTLETTWALAALAALLTFLQAWRFRGHRDGPVDAPLPLQTGLLLFLIWMVVSFVLSSTRNYGLDEVLRDAALVLLFLWAVREQALSPRFAERIVAAIAIATLLASAIGIAVYILQPVNRSVGTFFDWRFTTDYWPNAWAEFLLLGWPMVWFWTQRRSFLLRTVTLGIVLGTLLLSFSRGAVIVFFGQISFGCVLIGIRMWQQGKFSGRVREEGIAVAGIILCTAAITLATFAGVNALRSRFHEVESVVGKVTFTASEGVSSVSERRQFWEQALRLANARPLVGWGPYSFRFVQPRLQTEVYATSDHPHNVFLKLAMERGWIAAILFAFVLLAILIPAIGAIVRGHRRDDPLHPAMRTALLIAAAGVLAHNLIDYNLQFTGIAAPLWLTLALLVMPTKVHLKNTKIVHILPLLIATLLLIAAVLEGRFLLLSSLGRRAEAAVEIDTALAWYGRARGELFSRDMHLSRDTLFLQKNEPERAAEALDDYARVNQEDARLWILRGNAALRAGDHDDALRQYTEALRLGRYNYLEPLEGTLRILRDRPRAEAAARKSEFLDLVRRYGDAILHNAHFIALSQNVETFGRVSALLQGLYPDERGRLREFTSRVLRHAEEERAKSFSRSPGLLW